MGDPLRRVASRARDRLEGAAFRLLAGPAAPDASTQARRADLGRRGLRSYRELWWTSCALEPQRVLWNQALLLERLECEAPAWVPKERAGTLVVALGHLGDAMQTLPLLRALRESPGPGGVSVLAGPWAEWIFRQSGLADEVFVYEPALLQYRRAASGAGGIREALVSLRKPAARGFARVITTGPTDWASFAVVRAVRPLEWTGVLPRPDGFIPTGEEQIRAYDQEGPESGRLLKLADRDDASSQLFWPHVESARAAGRRFLTSIGCALDQPVLVVAPGGGWPGKLWAPGRFAEVSDALQRAHGASVVVVGSGAEHELGKAICRSGPGRWNACGRTTIEEFIGVTALATLVICNDSAALHFAAAAGVSTVSLFGPTRPGQWAPAGGMHRHLRAVASCPRCCPWHPRARCEEAVSCMSRIGVSEVMAAAEALWPAARARATEKE